MVERFRRPSDDNNSNSPDQYDDACPDAPEAIAAHPQVPPLIGLKKISPQLVGSFGVIERIGHLAHCLHLPDNMRIHSLISVAQLEPTANLTDDQHLPHQSPPLAPPLLGSFMSLRSYVTIGQSHRFRSAPLHPAVARTTRNMIPC